ncbi:unnamed protein product [Closterium sp. NIES-54]
MLALCREHRLEHRTKHIALRYFLAHELQQRGQLRLAYVASQANTADIFTKALPPGDHQRFCTMLDCVVFLLTSPKLCWTGEVGDASVFHVWGSCAIVRDMSADKLSPRAIPCVFLGFFPDVPGWQFYHPTSRCVFPSHDFTFDESVPFYRLFPYPSAPPQPPPLLLAPGPPPPGGAGSEGAEPEGVEPGGAEPQGAASSGGSAGASPRLSQQQLRAAGAGVTRGTETTGPGGARTRATGAVGSGGVAGAGAGDPMESGATGAGGSGAGSTGVVGTSAGGAGVGGFGLGGAGAGGAGVVDPGGTVRPRPYFVPLLQQVLGTPSSPGLTLPLLCPPPDQSQPPLQPASPRPAPSPYTEQSVGLT